MIQSGSGLGFSCQQGIRHLPCGAGTPDLDRHIASQLRIASARHIAETAGADRFEQFEPADMVFRDEYAAR